MSRRFGVQAIPTLLLMQHGRIIDKQIGAAPTTVLRSWLAEHMPRDEGGVPPADRPSDEGDRS